MNTNGFGQTANVRAQTTWALGGEDSGRCSILLPGQPLAWTTFPNIHGKNHNIPERSGIYAYAEVQREFGLPVAISWKYIGKSQNLRQRISSGHDPRFEANPELRRWLNRHPSNAELWFAPVDKGVLSRVEARLIRMARPDFNVRLV